MSHSPRRLAVENTRSPREPAAPVVSVAVIGDRLAEGAIAVDPRRVITYANRLVEGLLGVRADALLGRDVVSLASADGDGVARFARALGAALDGGTEQILSVNAADAPPFNVDYCRILPTADGGALVLFGEAMTPAISGQRAGVRSEPTLGDLERRASRLSALAKSQLAISRGELHDVYAEIYRAALASIPDAPCFALLLADADRVFRPQIVCVQGVITRSRALPTVPFGDCAATRAFETARPVVSDHPVRSWAALIPGAVPRDALTSELAVPVLRGDRTLGVLVVQSHRHDVFTPDDVEVLSIIARQAGAAIDNARLLEAERQARDLAVAASRIAAVALGSATLTHAAEAILAVLDDVVPTAGKALGVIARADDLIYLAASGAARGAAGLEVKLHESAAYKLLRPEDCRAGEDGSALEHGLDCDLARGGAILPLASTTRTLGVLAVAGTSGAALPEENIDTLRRLVPSVTLALEAQLLVESERRRFRQTEKLAALGELVAGVAHELNNPLAGISAFAQLLLEEPLSDDQRESARLIKREADRAVSVIRDLLLFSRKTGPGTVPVDLNALVRLTLRLRAFSLRAIGVDVQTDLDPALPKLVGDDQKLQQVLLNLIVNAEHAMRAAASRRLLVRTMCREGAIVIEVTDTGTGMSDETMQRVFEPFFTTKPPGEGTGLGLSVSYGIVEAHGGAIAVERAPGGGTTFRVVFPPPVPDGPATASE